MINPLYQYDGNGNMLSGGGRNFSYSVFNVPNVVELYMTKQRGATIRKPL